MRKFNIILVILLCVTLSGCNKDNYVELSTKTNDKVVTKETITTGIFVYITGRVKNPGVYEVKEGTRLYEVVDLAGGMTKKADKTAINLAEEVTDGQSIHIPSKTAESFSAEVSEKESTLININQATVEQLTQLPGIGDSKALAIITHREENGGFKSVEDIKNVSGIGDATFANLKDMITV